MYNCIVKEKDGENGRFFVVNYLEKFSCDLVWLVVEDLYFDWWDDGVVRICKSWCIDEDLCVFDCYLLDGFG